MRLYHGFVGLNRDVVYLKCVIIGPRVHTQIVQLVESNVAELCDRI